MVYNGWSIGPLMSVVYFHSASRSKVLGLMYCGGSAVTDDPWCIRTRHLPMGSWKQYCNSPPAILCRRTTESLVRLLCCWDIIMSLAQRQHRKSQGPHWRHPRIPSRPSGLPTLENVGQSGTLPHQSQPFHRYIFIALFITAYLFIPRTLLWICYCLLENEWSSECCIVNQNLPATCHIQNTTLKQRENRINID